MGEETRVKRQVETTPAASSKAALGCAATVGALCVFVSRLRWVDSSVPRFLKWGDEHVFPMCSSKGWDLLHFLSQMS